MGQNNATLTIPGQESIELSVRSGTLGNPVIDISPLAKNNAYTFDPGFVATAACESQITYIDGENGVLLHRGYPIQELAEHANYLEVCYLILQGNLPTTSELNSYIETIKEHTLVHEQLIHFFSGFPRSSHPMSILCAVVGGLSAFYHDRLDISSAEDREVAALRLVSKMPTIAAMAYKYSIGQPFIYPNNDFSYAENFLHMMFHVPPEKVKNIDPILVRAMDRILILHADHEQNASTSTVRIAGSSGANPFACVAAGIAALWGPAHGGANEAVLNMLDQIGDVKNINEYIARAKDKSDPFRLMGFGHRVYKNFDPRSVVMRKTCYEVLDFLGLDDDPAFKLALKLEQIALEDEYFIEKKLYPNVDFYSGIVLKALGIPTNMFTVIFALARTVGWVAHWQEMLDDPKFKISRPRQLYTGVTQQVYEPIDVRS